MKRLRRTTFPLLLFAVASLLLPSCNRTVRAEESPAEAADAAFQSGKFADGEKLYKQIAASDPRNYSAHLRLGEIALLANRLHDAESWLQKSLALQSDDAQAKTYLAEAYYRQDDFARAAEYLKTPGNGEFPGRAHFSSLNYEKLASFHGLIPYQISGSGDEVHLKFVKTDPLPLVEVRINGGKPAVLFVDTGGAEFGLDSEFAHELGLKEFASTVQGTFAGGEKASYSHSKIDSLVLGDWTIRNVPVQALPFRQLSSMFGVPRIDGCIGTILLYHFLSTIDYPAGELILRRRSPEIPHKRRPTTAPKSVAVPFWMAADHFILGEGRVNSLPNELFFLDSGLAGAAVNLPKSVLARAAIHLDQSQAVEGQGAAGTLTSIPYVVPEVSFGGIVQRNINGLYDGPVFWESDLGFRVGGMIGHEFLRPYAVTFDFDSMQIRFE
jgi:Aspartyl protease/Tetratricopeptide repeat